MSKKPFAEKTGLGKFLAKTAPKLLGLLGDGVPGVGLLKNLIGNDPDMDPADKLEADKLLLEYEKTDQAALYADLANARALQMKALDQDDLFSKRFIYYMAAFWSIISAGYLFAVTFIEFPEANTRLVDTITGFLLGSIIASIITFFFGSSSGSKEKTKGLIDRLKDKFYGRD